MTITAEDVTRSGVRGKPWTHEEVDVAVSTYFYMLRMQESGQVINKSECNRRAKAKLPARSLGSLSQKYSNISAILNLRNTQALDGYAPLFNFQKSLREAVERTLANDSALDRIAMQRVLSPVETPIISEYPSLLVPPPTGVFRNKAKAADIEAMPGSQKDYLAREALNRSIGLAGEILTLEFERSRLINAGRLDLALKVEHASSTKGDGLGYDIESYCTDGTRRLIEVKTTSYGINTPIFISANEVKCSALKSNEYWIYRVFNIRSKPRLFMVPGDVSTSFILETTAYRAWMRPQPHES